MHWQPIATAPRDGTYVLCTWVWSDSESGQQHWSGDMHVLAYFPHWHGDGQGAWVLNGDFAAHFAPDGIHETPPTCYGEPTHWRPLPAPPALAGSARSTPGTSEAARLPVQDIVIFDLDGTLALVEHRVHHLTGDTQDWRAFHAACPDDLPNAPIIALKHALTAQGYAFWIVSGRSDEVATETLAWLQQHVGAFDRLIMRPAGDQTPDDLLKRSWVEDGTIPQARVLMVFEDRASVVKMWRELGLTCLQVAPGDF
ncbi:MAG: hypothetical protein AB7N91_11040 [Candidatus Tectimicrobiota bacterium]